MNTSLVHNVLNDTRKATLLTSVSEMGNAEGKGLNAKPDYARAVLQASIDNVISSEDATALWEKFSSAVRRTKGDEHLRLGTQTDKVRVSETKRFIMVGNMVQVNPMDLFERSLNLIHNSEVSGSTYQNLTKVMREQGKNANAALTDAEIFDIICPAPAEKAEKELLESLLKTMTRVQDGTKGDADKGIAPKPGFPSEELAEAIAQVEARIATFTRAERIDEMLKVAAETGYSVVMDIQPSGTDTAEELAA